MQKSVALIFLLFINKIRTDSLLQVDHHYETLNFDTANLLKLKSHREKRSVNLDEQLFEKELKKELNKEIDKSHFFEKFDRELAKNRLNHFYSKPNLENYIDDDDEFKKQNFLNLHKNEAINQKLKDKNFQINFFAHNRNFKILIKGNHNNDVFAPNAEFESTNRGKFNYDKHNIFHGSLEDDNRSHVEGVITHDGLIDGFIKTKDEEFFIEPARNYAKNKTDLHNKIHNNSTFHSIIYKLSDLTFPNFTCKNHFHNFENFQKNEHFLNKRHALQDTFDTKLDFKLNNESKLNSFQYTNSSSKLSEADILNNKYLQIARKNKVSKNNNNTKKKYPKKNDKVIPPNNRKYYWKEMDALHYNSEAYGVRAIQKTHWTSDVEQSHLVVDSRKSTCMLYLQADHLFYSKMGSEEACIETMIRHVQKVNSIYRVTDFDQDGRSDNISFLIKRIKVHTSDAVNDSEYRFPLNYGVERFLELFSEEDYDAFCLAYMFTYRDFEGGTLGLAWTGDLKNAGGVCEKNGHYRGSLKSLNTGIVTLLNYGKHVPPIVSHVTLAHEIGHNFGSPHDPEVDEHCTPGGENGNYIMFARATSGDKKNNNKFSPCSLKSVNAVLNTKARSLKGCFQEPQEAICGNEVVEPGEECDCGWIDGCTEPCCYPMRSNPPANETPCKLKPGFVCSPSQGPCCTQKCELRVGNKCRDDNGCRTASYCNGQGPKCPASTNKPNKTICNEESVCFMGECTGSICIAYGLESCQCKKKEGDQNKRGDQLCELCCRMPGDDSTCKTSFEWNTAPYDVPDLFAKPGTPCDNYNGYCDVNQVCRILNPSGALEALATLRRFLLSDQSVAFLRNWVQHQWMCAGILCCIAFVLCGLLLRALRKANAYQQEQYKNSSNLINPNVLCNNPISNGFLFSSSTNYNQPNNSANIATNVPNSNFDNNLNNTYSLTSNTNYSNAYGFNSMTNDNSNIIKNTFADYGINNPSSINKSTDLNSSLFKDLKNNHTASFLTKSMNKNYPNTTENEIQNLQIKNLNSTNLNQSSKINNLSQNQQKVKQNSSSYNTNDYNNFQSNFSSYDSNINLVKRQNRLINESLMKNIPSINNLVSSSTSSVNNFNKANNAVHSNNYIPSSKANSNKFSNSALSYQHQINNLNQQNSMNPNFQPFQTQYFQQTSQSVSKTNSTATKSTEYGHTPLSLNNEWV